MPRLMQTPIKGDKIAAVHHTLDRQTHLNHRLDRTTLLAVPHSFRKCPLAYSSYLCFECALKPWGLEFPCLIEEQTAVVMLFLSTKLDVVQDRHDGDTSLKQHEERGSRKVSGTLG